MVDMSMPCPLDVQMYFQNVWEKKLIIIDLLKIIIIYSFTEYVGIISTCKISIDCTLLNIKICNPIIKMVDEIFAKLAH